MNDNRRITRKRVLKTGKILVGRTSIIDCTVRDVSESGACLKVESPLGIPDTFDLLITTEQTPRPCRIVWRKEKQIGVKFQ